MEETTSIQVSELPELTEPETTTTESQTLTIPAEVIDYTKILERISSSVVSIDDKLTSSSYFEENGITHFVNTSNNNDVVFLLLMIVILLGSIFGAVLFRSFRK